ncbi:MAG: OmpA family protein [Flavobacteriales bacterium]
MTKIFSRMALLAISGVVIMQSCVPNRKYQELTAEKNTVESDNIALREANEDLTTKYNETMSENDMLDEKLKGLKSDTTILGTSLRHMTEKYDKINQLNEIMTAKSSALLQESIDENKELLAELDITRQALLTKEDLLNVLEADLNEKEANLNQISSDLEEKAQRVSELEELLEAQQSAVNSLRDKVEQALLGFTGDGLTIEKKNGKVYVSLEANLLFPSGSTVINAEGKQALIELAKAIQDQSDLEIIVEGHTDTDKMSSASHPKDNWELSVLRATSVVKLMTSNSTLDPKILSASGKSEYVPVNPSDKSKNRRIEIILSPNLDELFQIIEGE